MEYVILKQEKALKGRILSILILAFSVFYAFQTSVPIYSRIFMLLIALGMFGFSISYKINLDFNNQKLFSIFGVVLIKTKLKLEFPDYISVFSTSFKLDNEWGAVSAIGTQEKHDKTVVRFFTGNRYATLYRSASYQKALDKAKALHTMLSIEIYEADKS
ncbi:hypothetical protein J8281_16695 [Aquimarina sp. U1-2]|uniref:hypothetical protein n=1 Tax=Aquimarina sp. U1-2 TaxID=2823141 RepID=UPI001AECE3FA|nr:hypothetical protein [Aquimarina sp. U1-2]MBP2833836.1 hypothetical protein [Aquimarina sp. U1-2]